MRGLRALYDSVMDHKRLTSIAPDWVRVFSNEEGREVGEMLAASFAWLGHCGALALLDDNTSNFPMLATASPLLGYVFEIRHDDDPVVLARSMENFVGLAERVWSAGGELGEEHALGATRSEQDELAAAWLFSSCEGDDPGLIVAAQLTGDAWPDLLLPVIDTEDFDSTWAREAAARRLAAIGDERALPALTRLAERQADSQDGRAARRAIDAIHRRLAIEE